MNIDVAVSNNFAFGGANASIVWAKPGARPAPPAPDRDRVVITGMTPFTSVGTDAEALWQAYSGRHVRLRGRGGPRGLRAVRVPEAQGAQARRPDRAVQRHHRAARARGRGARDHRRQPRAGRRDRRHRHRADAVAGGVLAADHRGRARRWPTRRSSRTRSTTPPAGRRRSSSARSASASTVTAAARRGRAGADLRVRPDVGQPGRRRARDRLGLAHRHRRRRLPRPRAARAASRSPRRASRSCVERRGRGRRARRARLRRARRLRRDVATPRASGAGTARARASSARCAWRWRWRASTPATSSPCGPTPPASSRPTSPERAAIARVFGDDVAVRTPKVKLGEPLGAGGSLNTALALLAWQHGVDVGPVVVNSSSLGGTHISLVLVPTEAVAWSPRSSAPAPTSRASRSATSAWRSSSGRCRRTSWRASRSPSATGWSTWRPASTSSTTRRWRSRRRSDALANAGIDAERGRPARAVAPRRPDYLLPPLVTFVQEALGLERCATMEIRSGCAGFGEALDVARLYIEKGQYKTAVVIGSPRRSRR